ncbi:hypothetical protein HMPREF0538_20224 [Limosilactobacillus reuteri SD2112]|uniref:Uncharacterized protein n=2 Tax=Limosilactobacillus reuteri TaxID=1598 RepID=F8DL61_LIMRS|nr:hypothetical protein HMPREF0538_20224 [Limosilactobacillus reuteri SD2112]
MLNPSVLKIVKPEFLNLAFLIGIIFLLCYSKMYESDITERWREEK